MRYLFITSRRDHFEIGARLIAALAFPGADEAAKRRSAAMAWCTDYVRKWVDLEPHRVEELRSAYPLYFTMPRREVKAALRTAYNRLDKRILAGKMARGIFQERETGRPVVLPDGMRRHSLNELSKLVLAESHQSDPHNVETRVWGSSKAAIHLASGYDFMAQCLPAELEGQYDMTNRALHRWLIDYGQRAEEIVVAAKPFRIRSDQLLRVRLH